MPDNVRGLARRLPDLLSLTRIPLSLALPFCARPSAAFWCVYLACGLTDALDGFLARRLGTASARGAALDSVADLFFFAALLHTCRHLLRPAWASCGLAAICLIRLLACIVGQRRFRAPLPPHTRLNRLCGLLVFAAPLLEVLLRANAAAAILLSACLAASVEELLMRLTLPAHDPDRRSLFF